MQARKVIKLQGIFKKIGALFSSFCFVAVVLSFDLHAQPVTQLSEGNIAHLRTISSDHFDFLRERDPLVLPPGVAPEEILEVDFETARHVIDIFIAEGWSTFEFFTHPFLVSGRKMLFYPSVVLEQLFQLYRMPSLFPVQTDDADGGSSKIKMSGLLLGKGRIVVFYPKNFEVKRLDKPFDILTGRYSFFRTNWVSICETEGINGLCDFEGRNSPGGAMSPIRGPFNVPLKRIRPVVGKRFIRVYLPVGFLSFAQPLFGYVGNASIGFGKP